MEWIIPTLLYRCTCRWTIRFSLRCEQLLTAKHWGIVLFQVRSVRADPAGGGVPGRDGGLRSVQGSHPIAGLTGIPTLTNQILAPLQWLLTSLYSTNLILAPLQWLLTSLYLQPIRYSPLCSGCWRHSTINQLDACQTRLLTSPFLPPIRDSPYANINQKPVPKMKSPYLPLARGLFVTSVSAFKMFLAPPPPIICEQCHASPITESFRNLASDVTLPSANQICLNLWRHTTFHQLDYFLLLCTLCLSFVWCSCSLLHSRLLVYSGTRSAGSDVVNTHSLNAKFVSI